MKEHKAAKASTMSSTTSKPITQTSQPSQLERRPKPSNETEDLPEVTIVKRAAKWTIIEWIKTNLKNGKDTWTQRDTQATKEALSHIHKNTRNGQQKQAPIAPVAIGLGRAGGLAATNVAKS